MSGPAEASTSSSKRVEPPTTPLTVHGGGSIHGYVSTALTHLFSDARPAVVLTASEAGNAATALSKIISVAEVTKREYTKQLSDSSKGKQRLPARLWQYNHLTQRLNPKEESKGEGEDPRKEHDEALEKLFEMQPGQKRPKKKHEPRLSITLSTRRVTGHPGSFQSPGEASKRKRKQRRNRAERKSRQQDQEQGHDQQAAGQTETGQTHKRKRGDDQ